MSAGAVVRVHAAEPLARRVADLGLRVAEHRLPARREVQPVGADVPVPQAVVGALERERVALLGLRQAAQRALVGDRVAQAALQRRRARDAPGSRRRRPRSAATSVSRSAWSSSRITGACGLWARMSRGDVEPVVAGVVQLAVDQERVVRVLLERGERGARRRDPVDLVLGALDRLQRRADRRVRGLVGLHGEQRPGARAGGSRGLLLRRQDRGLEPVGGEDLHELDEGEEGDGLGQVGVDAGVVGGGRRLRGRRRRSAPRPGCGAGLDLT